MSEIAEGPWSGLVENFARLHVLVSLFDGDPDKWIRYIERHGTDSERQHDLAFIASLKTRIASHPGLLDDARRVVRELSAILMP